MIYNNSLFRNIFNSMVFITCATITTAACAAPAKDKTEALNKGRTQNSSAALAATAATQSILGHHLGAFAEGIDAVMADYTERSVLITSEKTYKGIKEIRDFFDFFIKSADPEFWKAFKIRTQSIDGEIAYLVWDAKPFILMATDTFVIRNKKIATQTFTSLAQ